ncbi:hypothetical protein GGF37_006634 [Kickxella alabastrina]|nr:hypothetical protein GGF37_006634 [Kickxella alabastrina]
MGLNVVTDDEGDSVDSVDVKRLKLSVSASSTSPGFISSSKSGGGSSSKPLAAPNALVFAVPPESLSLRTQISITSAHPLTTLIPLQHPHQHYSDNSSPASAIAQSLYYWEYLLPTTTAPHSSAAATAAAAGRKEKTTGELHEALHSLICLQRQFPAQYPFVYVCVRDYTVIFKMVPQPPSAPDDPNRKEGDNAGYRSVCVVSQSVLGLRRALDQAQVAFTLPLAPKLRTWDELSSQGQADTGHLRDITVDRTWRSALLITDKSSVQGLFQYLLGTEMKDASVYAPGAFINGTMRRCRVSASEAMAYEAGVQRRVWRLDMRGVFLPNAWHAILVALRGSLCVTGSAALGVASRESPETVYLNMLVSRQGSSVANKKTISVTADSFTYT